MRGPDPMGSPNLDYENSLVNSVLLSRTSWTTSYRQHDGCGVKRPGPLVRCDCTDSIGPKVIIIKRKFKPIYETMFVAVVFIWNKLQKIVTEVHDI